MSERAGILLRLDPAVRDALARWAADELRSTNAQIDFLLRRALDRAGRLPAQAGGVRPRGRLRTRGSAERPGPSGGPGDPQGSGGSGGPGGSSSGERPGRTRP